MAPLLLLTVGCSLIIKGPPARPIAVDQEVDCTADPSAPIADALVAVPAFLGGAGWVIENAGKTCTEDPCGPKIAVGLGVALLILGTVYGISSVHGFQKVGGCRALIRSQLKCRNGDTAACAKLQPEPSPPKKLDPGSPSDSYEN